MQDRKRLEEAIEQRRAASARMTDDLDTLFELAREGENVDGDIERELKRYSEAARASSKPPCCSRARTMRATPS